jgi:outer membrane protein TolC
MTLRKAFIYTITGSIFLLLFSYLASSQPRRLSLKEALQLTLNNNRDIKISALATDKSREQTTIAKSLALPAIGISGQIAHYFNEPAFFGFGSTGSSSNDKIEYGRFGGKDQVNAVLFLNQPVYNAAIKPSFAYSKLREKESELLLAGKKTEIAAILKQTYIQILVLNERIKLQKESIVRNEKALEDAKYLFAQGKALRVDTLRAYTSVKNLEPELLKLSNAVEVGKQRLKTLTGIDSTSEIEIKDSLILPEINILLTEEDVYREAKEQRPDLQALNLKEDINEQEVKIVAAATKPTVSVGGQYLVQSQSNKFNYFNAYYPSTTWVGVQIGIPIFNGFSNKAKISQAKIEKRQSVIQTQNAREELRAEVKQVVSNVEETAARIKASLNIKETAVLSYTIIQYRYVKGVASRLELTDAELALTTAQSNYLEAVYDYLSARIALDLIAGKTGE